MLFAPVHRRRPDTVPSEDPRRTGSLGKAHDEQVGTVMLVKAGCTRRHFHPGNHRDIRKRYGQGRHRQDRFDWLALADADFSARARPARFKTEVRGSKARSRVCPTASTGPAEGFFDLGERVMVLPLLKLALMKQISGWSRPPKGGFGG